MPITILEIILILLVLLCIYFVYNANHKLKNLKKRYDYLLRGRGDVNIEELLISQMNEIDKLKKSQLSLDKYHKELKLRVNTIDVDKAEVFREEASIFESKINSRVSAVEKEISSNFRELDLFTRGRVAEIEKNVIARLEDDKRNLSGQIRNLDKDLNRKIVEQKGYFSEEIVSIKKDSYSKFAEVDEKYIAQSARINSNFDTLNQGIEKNNNNIKSIISNLENSFNKKLKNLENIHDVDVKALQSSIEEKQKEQQNLLLSNVEKINKDISINKKSLEEHISLSIQKVHLHKYNAFDDMAGEQSYTAVFLDELNNGLLITSIYSRHGSSTFAKEVLGGRCTTQMSPEEEETLKKAIKK